MTVEELKEQAKLLEKMLARLLHKFEKRTGCRVSEIRVKEDGPEIYDVEVEVRLDPLPYPERFPKANAL